MAEGYFFQRDGESARFIPSPYNRGPWDPKTMHARVVSGLMAAEVERAYGDPDFQTARLTFDLFRSPHRQPVSISTRMVRDGNRIRVMDASACFDDGTEMARASILMLRRTDPPAGEVWTREIEPMPHPDSLRVPPENERKMPWATWERRRVTGDLIGLGPKRIWTREILDLVEGEPLTPMVRAALSSDLTNPLSNSGTKNVGFINADINVHMFRNPDGEWIGMETVGHQSASGVALGECVMHDVHGVFARVSVCSLANERRHDIAATPGPRP